MPDDFFQSDTAPEAVEKIKLGDEEYSQEDLQRLVGLGKIGLEAEEKYKTKIDKVWPKYQQVINENKELRDTQARAAEEARARAEEETARARGEQRQLTPEQMRQEALKQAEDLGIGPSSIRKTVMEVIQGQQLLADINSTIDTMKADGLPATSVDEVIQHMQETGIRNPEKAYKDMFEKEWIQSQTSKLNSLRQPGMPTVSQSSAGSKQPVPVKITGENFEKLFAAAMSGEPVS